MPHLNLVDFPKALRFERLNKLEFRAALHQCGS